MSSPPEPAESTTETLTFADALARAIELLRHEQLDAADALLGQLRAYRPDDADVLHFLGVLRHAQGDTTAAVDLLRESVALVPDNDGAWNNLGNVLLKAGRADEALHAYTRSAMLAEAGPEPARASGTRANLSALHRGAGRLAEAESQARHAVALDDANATAWYALASALLRQGRVEEGVRANARAIVLLPGELMQRQSVIQALLLLGERERAIGLYREWLAEEPDNPVVRHQLTACEGGEAPARASDAYIEDVFDRFSTSFDASLAKLHYAAPGLVAAALTRAVGAPLGTLSVCDAGCGTGLCGPLIKAHAARLAGCDLSVGMLRQARTRGVYDVLHKAELVYYLDTQPEHFDAIVCADTLCYFGPLDGFLAAARKSLKPGGCAVFTVESLQAPDGSVEAPDANADLRLRPTGRYAHAPRYVRAAIEAAGLHPQRVDAAVLRHEAGRPVHGLVVTLVR